MLHAQIVVATAVFLATLGRACEKKYLVVDRGNHRVQLCGITCTTVAGTGVAGSGASQLDHPSGVTVHDDGDYVITDTENHRIQKCPKAGTGACSTVAGTGSAGAGNTLLNNPLGNVIFHEDGDYVITDQKNHRVQKCPSKTPGASCTSVVGTGILGGSATTLNFPTGTVLHEDGDYLTTDSSNHRVQKCPKAGTGACTKVAGTHSLMPGSDATALKDPAGMTIHEDGDYVIADDGNFRVQKCPKAGTGACTTMAGTGSAGAGNTQFSRVIGIVMHEDGDSVITDMGNHRVQKCPKTQGEACITVAGGYGAGSGATQLHGPRGINFAPCPATCADKNASSGPVMAVTDAECGAGYMATNTSTKCSKTPCEVNTGMMADKNTCCEAYGCKTALGTDCASCVAVALRTSATHCSTCKPGYRLLNTNCQAYACTTGGGAGCGACVPQADRLSDMHCATCNEGYKLVNSSCQVSEESKGNATGAANVSFSGDFYLQATWAEDPAGTQMLKAAKAALAKQLKVDISAVTTTAKVRNGKLQVSFIVTVPKDAAKEVETILTDMKRSTDNLTAEVKKQLVILGFPEADLDTVRISTFFAKKVCAVGDKECHDSAMVSEGKGLRKPSVFMITAVLIASVLM